MFEKLSEIVLPWWARALALAACGACIFLLGQLHGERVAGEARLAEVHAEVAATEKVEQAQFQVILNSTIQFADLMQDITIKGEEIEKEAPTLVTVADDDRYGVNAGFVRSFNAAWANDPAGAAEESDREPAGIPLADIAEADAFNATACHAWRAQALTLRELYQSMRLTTAPVPPPNESP